MRAKEEDIPNPGAAQGKFIEELWRLIPESMWLTAFNRSLYVGATIREGGKKGVVRLLFFNHTRGQPSDVGPVIGWEDGSITVPPAVLEYLAGF